MKLGDLSAKSTSLPPGSPRVTTRKCVPRPRRRHCRPCRTPKKKDKRASSGELLVVVIAVRERTRTPTPPRSSGEPPRMCSYVPSRGSLASILCCTICSNSVSRGDCCILSRSDHHVLSRAIRALGAHRRICPAYAFALAVSLPCTDAAVGPNEEQFAG
ncbi:uncharacterized protein PHACADRAFT_266315 [Phanerochaete carnosa HHB-10118-sp]|uniref:Uncharacterized protein n=1 Tax=Phanerochaete carnosa (strain HHB-10118-sp) TaxID=650164 RepID=K5VBN3_PHACS|nr:uncharacterized protein PHACADRAFT_266315 [Phanerochaete carnosa HHB-10118-sp]EKM48518.1 hypothetical protein PHACADRAFT_266315 [Phanerochaete carnosa HHB-10118-sp]